jgi:hypothetical protein
MLAFNMVRDQLPHGILDDTPRNTGFVIGVYGDAAKYLSEASAKVSLDRVNDSLINICSAPIVGVECEWLRRSYLIPSQRS